MLPGFEFLEENCQLDELFHSWRSELPITSKEEENIIFPNYDKIANKTEKDVLDLSDFKEFDLNFLQNSSELGEINEIRNEIKLEPESPDAQFSLSSGSPNHSESNDSDKQETRCFMQEVSNCSAQNVDTELSLRSPLISCVQYTSSSSQSFQSSLNVMQPVEFVSVDEEDARHAQFIQTKRDFAKHINIQCSPVDVAQHIKNGKSEDTFILQDFATFTQNENSQCVLYPSKLQMLPTKRHARVQNSLNIKPTDIKTKTAALHLPQNVKVINTVSDICPASTAESIDTSNLISCIPFQIMQDEKISLIAKNQENDFTFLTKDDPKLKALKRQQRMIRNRESASLSRKKKKEYVSSLEKRIDELMQENTQLKSENKTLKQRLLEMEDSITDDNKYKHKRKHLSFKPLLKKKGQRNLVLFVGMIFIISFNIHGLKGTLSQSVHLKTDSDNLPIAIPDTEIRHNRRLFWTVDENEDQIEKDFNKSAHQLMCPMYINQSELIRLDSELRRWIDGESDRNNRSAKEIKLKLKTNPLNELLSSKSQLEEKTKRKLYLSRDKKIKTIHKMIDIPDRYSNDNAIEIFSPILSKHASLFEALGKKDDTFYVVWFSGEHLLLPASRKNDTARPKMSLVLPAVSINGTFSTPSNHITMMQIDCEVTNTQILHLQQSIIPVHLRNSKSTSQSNQPQSVEDIVNSSIANITRNYKPYFIREANRKFRNRKHLT
ncbi:cyclic AMP-dependent transcription factor ATF-6 alpha [Formica exsecta]|uniref:cyclic AMP-dependent transcription factor ATF-6 alpha n=1 Tax=Formica exsecta TaxID=72781 RepID=UPI001142999E|nr:cyclic AMP-dependent transcription factor ATF-6 alpha [Formica exsecta]